MKNRRAWLAALSAPALLIGAASCKNTDGANGESIIAPPGVMGPRQENADVIRPGDTLELFVLEDSRYNGRYPVRTEGHIVIPEVGRIKVGGMSMAAGERAVKKSLEGGQLTNPRVILEKIALPVRPGIAAERIEVFLSGKVQSPGRYQVAYVDDSPPTVHQAILQAGGPARFANRKKVHILRKQPDGKLGRIPVNLEAIEGGTESDVSLASGDIVVIPEKRIGGL